MMEVKKVKKEEIMKKISEEEEKEGKKKIRKIYFKLIEILKNFVDMREDYYSLVSLWIIGTYFHKQFPTYPYLYFNAMKGSGKSRVLNLLSNLVWNGKLLISLSEAVLFRTASQSSFCIDELEGIGGKNQQALRELLNAGYKRGMFVERAKKVKTRGEGGKLEESFEIERYSLYCPIAMANIWGMDDVLGDRCLTLTLERSQNATITKKIEDFEDNDAIIKIKSLFNSISSVSSVKIMEKIYTYKQWNAYINERYNTTYTTYTTNTTNTTNTTKTAYLFDKIGNTELNSRHLELFFPLFVLAYGCGEDILGITIKTSKTLVKEKKEADVEENKDVMLIEYVSQEEKLEDFIPLNEILSGFRAFFSDDEEERKWINSRWLGRALKRLVLVKDKRRVNGKRQVILNISKAKDKIKIFKEIDDENEPQNSQKTTEN